MRYRFPAAGGSTVRCRWHALGYGPVRRRALRVAGIVGTVLVLINQADVIVDGQLTPGVAAKIALTYLVPFAVSTYSALAISRLPEPP
ncbi:MAG: nitrate/nitrite transporter NrtS [Chloroflexota bacterium]|nr:nitrate/nitrite transporter NrtS [Chloroflexota bacterium]MDP9473905.1 nitrate/nitrite transporter NrtS [Chloroflexota bacterium]